MAQRQAYEYPATPVDEESKPDLFNNVPMHSLDKKSEVEDGQTVFTTGRPVGHAEPTPMYVHRKLNPRQIQLLALAGTVGAALFVGIGASLTAGGPLSLFIAVSFWVSVIFIVAHCQAEIVSLLPLDGSFIRLADRFVDEAYGVMTGYNYFIFQCALLCFEISIFTVVIGYWKALNPAILTSVLVFVYFILNVWTAALFGEAEFWLAMGKLLLILGMLLYTFFTMVGANPQREAYGFTYWKNPGAMAEYLATGSLGKFQGFVQCIVGAAFLVAGPEYISMVAGEAKNPRKVMPRAFTSIVYRLVAFFILGSLACGIVVPYNDPNLLSNTKPTAAGSPYVISMVRLGIPVLPSIVNALIATSIFSAGNAYMFGTSRSLYSLALQGHAPKIFRTVNRNGTPWIAVCMTSLLSLLAYLSVSAGSAKVLNWFVSLVTAGQLMNWLIMLTTWKRFRAGLKAQGLDKKPGFLPYQSPILKFGPTWYYAFIMAMLVLGVSGWTVLLPGGFAPDQFIFAYGMCFLDLLIFVGWKVAKRTSFRRAAEMDFVSDMVELKVYEQEYAAEVSSRPDTQNLNMFQRLNARVWD